MVEGKIKVLKRNYKRVSFWHQNFLNNTYISQALLKELIK